MNIIQNIKENWKSGITVSLVSIPLSVSLAVASQTSPVAGIVTAIWAGLIASIFGGSKFNIVGPTGALSGLLATFAIANGANALPVLAFMTGLLILAAYVFKLEKYMTFVPASTIHGFTLGVAFIISLNQLSSALGIVGLPAHEKLVDNVVELVRHFNQANFITVLIFGLFLFSLIFLAKYFSKIPGAILLTPIGILIGYLSSTGILPFTIQTLGMKYSDLTPVLFIPSKFYFDIQLLSTALVVAFVAILETMISAKIADGMTKTKHHKRKEMLGLGLANLFSGAMGGIPSTAALARTSLNIKSGASDKISATISSISIALISFIFLGYFKYIPMAVIAAILVNVAIKMVEMEHFKKMFHFDKLSFYLSMLVAFVTIYEDPTVGILFGVAISLLIFVQKLSDGQFELIVNDQRKKMSHTIIGSGKDMPQIKFKADTLVYSFKGQLAYINGQSHLSRFETGFGKDYKNLVLRFRGVYFIDLDGVDVLDEIIETANAQGKKVLITGVSPLVSKVLEQSHIYMKMKRNKQVFDKASDALISLGYKI